jgi:hypothetical protein
MISTPRYTVLGTQKERVLISLEPMVEQILLLYDVYQ